MSLANFKKLIKTNAREEANNPDEFVQYLVGSATIAFPKEKYSYKAGKARENPTAPFTFEVLNKQWKQFQSTDKARRQATFDMKTGLFQFHWFTRTGFDFRKETRYVEQGARNFIPKVLNKDMRTSDAARESFGEEPISHIPRGDDSQVGGHIESQAFLQVLRKALGAGLITPAEATDIRKSYLEGKMGEALGRAGAKTSVGTKDSTLDRDEGFLNITESTEAFEVDNKLLKQINENDSDFGITREVMLPIPRFLNKAQEKNYEKQAIKALKAEMENLADEQLYEDPTSPSMERMHQEIIAAALLGKKTPKYKVNHKFKERKAPKTKKKKVSLPKTKRAASKAQLIKFKRQLRTVANQSPTSLLALINTKLQRELLDNMGHPALENVTGRFRNSVRVLKVTQAANQSIQYTYDRDPYGVFEKDRDRDPRILIDRTIREIAAELVMGKFTTQRL